MRADDAERDGAGPPDHSARVLIVEDDEQLREAYAEVLREEGYEVEAAAGSGRAIEVLDRGQLSTLDVVLSDIQMPGMSGLDLLRAVRERDLDLPVLLMTGNPTVDTAIGAVEHGALRYLLKPVTLDALVSSVAEAVRVSRLARLKSADLELGPGRRLRGGGAGLEAAFGRAVGSLRIAYQPIVRAGGELFGYEALARTEEPTLLRPSNLFDLAERLGRVQFLGRSVREMVVPSVAPLAAKGLSAFVNLHANEMMDENLYRADTEFAGMARSIVLEVTERTMLDEIPEVKARIARLKALGFRIAIDDLGAGYAGLTSFPILEPHIVKLDMAMVRNVDREPMKRRLIESMTRVCRESGILVVAEGVETRAEHEVLVALGCDLLQGYAIGRPGPLPGESGDAPSFPAVRPGGD